MSDKYGWSLDGEGYQDQFSSRAEALDAASKAAAENCVKEVYTCRCQFYNASHFVPDADMVVEWMQEQIYDLGGEWAEDYPNLKPGGGAALDAALKSWANEWVYKMEWYTAKDVMTHTGCGGAGCRV